ncbi:MAG: hypothetical protein R3C14_29855 [Caldilineaceae bacterium]
MGTKLWSQDGAAIALEDLLQEVEQQEIDRQFALMVEDESYQALNQQVADEFGESDWEAWIVGETSCNLL